MAQTLWRVRFLTTRVVPGFPYVATLASDQVASARYAFDGRKRRAGHCVFQFTLSGEGRFRRGESIFRLPAGTGFLCDIGDPETGYWYPQEATESWVHMFVGMRSAAGLVRALTDRFGHVFRVDLDAPLIQRLREYERQDDAILELTPGESASMVMSLLATLADAGAQETHETADAWLVREARRAVRAHLEENFNVADLASHLSVSSAHLCRVFRRELGLTPLKYLTQEKTRRACELLVDTQLSCKEISTRLGYDTASHFARTFRRVLGSTPREFRRRGGLPVY